MDESFAPPPAGLFAVGCLLGRGVALFELERKWEALRKRSDINIAYFKASECERAKKEFAKFARDPKAELVAQPYGALAPEISSRCGLCWHKEQVFGD